MQNVQSKLRMLPRLGCGVALSLALAMPVKAAAPEAWEQFRQDVQSACLAAGQQQLQDPAIVVDPFGSEKYGLALLTGVEQQGTELRSIICVYDKAAKSVELGNPLNTATTAASGRETAEPEVSDGTVGPGGPFGGQCGEECEATLALLAEEDREKLTDLPEIIARTIVENPEPTGEAKVDNVREMALSLSERVSGVPSEQLQRPQGALGGKVACSVYFYGFLDEPAKLVGNHTCSVTELEGGALLVEKNTGERLRAEIHPLTDGFSAFIGRNFLADQSERDYDASNPVNAGNENFGNSVGLATQMGGQMYLLSSEQRGHEKPDESFFWVLAIGG
ncbi:hypothetical protein [Aureimonas fodinaquatilis]|uniref:hypothetical protein n=1 Tax=Aureimonas fodinaquatilis TaxID=2565783 RepID=UPI00165E3CD1|nr:hypothetical protein [Aureimonas fodinaquatilis]